MNVYGSYDKEARRYAVLALGNLAISFESHGDLMRSRCIEALNSCLDSPDDETRFSAAFALNKLSTNEDNLQKLGEYGVIPHLVDTLSSTSKDTVAQAIGCLRHLAGFPDNRMLMLTAKILDPMGEVAKSEVRLFTFVDGVIASFCVLEFFAYELVVIFLRTTTS